VHPALSYWCMRPSDIQRTIFEQGDVIVMTPEDMMSTDGKEATGGGFLTGEQVQTYFSPYEQCTEIPFARAVVDGSFNKNLYVFVSKQKPQFLGRSHQRLVFDTSQLSFLSELRAGAGVTGAGRGGLEEGQAEAGFPLETGKKRRGP
jgi:hypothetical protein